MTEVSVRSEEIALLSQSGKYFTTSSTAAFQALVACGVTLYAMQDEQWVQRRINIKELIETGMQHTYVQHVSFNQVLIMAEREELIVFRYLPV